MRIAIVMIKFLLLIFVLAMILILAVIFILGVMVIKSFIANFINNSSISASEKRKTFDEDIEAVAKEIKKRQKV